MTSHRGCGLSAGVVPAAINRGGGSDHRPIASSSAIAVARFGRPHTGTRDNATAEVHRSFRQVAPLYQAAYLPGGEQIRSLRRELVDSGVF